MEAYCVRCRKMRKIKGEHKSKINGRNVIQGKCQICDTKMTKFI